jgi:hypothetical protein
VATVLSMLRCLRNTYGLNSFRFSDYILPHGYFRTLLPILAEEEPRFQLACEMKANTNEENFGALARAGFRDVQPGIESFSTPVLRLMNKGVSAGQNVHTLLLGRRFGVHINYNLIYGFPAETEACYEEMICLLPRLFHLDPPITNIAVMITRFAPLQTDPKRFSTPLASYEPSYEIIFSEDFLNRTGFQLARYGPSKTALFCRSR